MDKSQIDSWVMSNNDKLDPMQMQQIRTKLEQADENRAKMIMAVELSSPTTMLLITLFAGGFSVHNFMLGKTGKAIAGLLTAQALGIMWIIDLINNKKNTCEYNFKKLISL